MAASSSTVKTIVWTAVCTASTPWIANPHTVLARIRFDRKEQLNRQLSSAYLGPDHETPWQLKVGHNLGLIAIQAANTAYSTSVVNTESNRWYLVGIRFTGNRLDLLVDGVVAASTVLPEGSQVDPPHTTAAT